MKKFINIFTSVLLISISTSVFAEKKESPLQVSGAITVNAATAKTLFDEGVPFIDVRKNKDWDAGRIPGAKHLELKKVFSESALSAVVKKTDKVVIYCNGPKCMRSSKASRKAVEWGFKKVHYFRDGIPAWKKAKYPVE